MAFLYLIIDISISSCVTAASRKQRTRVKMLSPDHPHLLLLETPCTARTRTHAHTHTHARTHTHKCQHTHNTARKSANGDFFFVHTNTKPTTEQVTCHIAAAFKKKADAFSACECACQQKEKNVHVSVLWAQARSLCAEGLNNALTEP